jgi:hypothetical protein
MSKLTNFDYEEKNGSRIWRYGKPGHPEARLENPGKYGRDDWVAKLIAPPTCEVAPTITAAVLVAGTIAYSQRLWPASQFFDLDAAGYIEKAIYAESITDVILIAKEADVIWNAYRRSLGGR